MSVTQAFFEGKTMGPSKPFHGVIYKGSNYYLANKFDSMEILTRKMLDKINQLKDRTTILEGGTPGSSHTEFSDEFSDEFA